MIERDQAAAETGEEPEATVYEPRYPFARLIRDVRRTRLEMTQHVFAERVGLGLSTVTNAETIGTSHRLPGIGTAIIIGKALGLPVERIVLAWAAGRLDAEAARGRAGGEDVDYLVAYVERLGALYALGICVLDAPAGVLLRAPGGRDAVCRVMEPPLVDGLAQHAPSC